MDMEYKGAITKMQKTFVEGLTEIFSYWIYYLKACDPNNSPPFSNDEVAECHLQLYFKVAPPEIFEYLHTDKSTFIKDIIAPRAARITYMHDDDLSEKSISKAESFKKKATDLIFSNIPEVSFTLLKIHC